ncbi:class I SAM-dependent methyltransferase [Chryseolinea lacunae]|uniref:Class I SAM-dependent methyltransferase n=1 Tax=Chryseolinea lacunae TaxID=2801331 RepID=A0ABS1KMF2_9BACT|nr:class I SAM-dependent methyltransferase [Chryseolinea lacunae]MBL0740611.1 class I SAM-dependent methyltransferase [Chryseolinea lacunae]
MSVLATEKKAIDSQKVEQFAGQFILDLSANYSGVMTFLGLELGLYEAMRGAGPLTPGQLAVKTKTFERYVREWLNNQAAGGYVAYDPGTKTYALPEEHALVLLEKDSPVLLGPAYFIVSSLWKDKTKLIDAFKSGIGIGWHEHHHDLFHGIEAVYRTGYLANLNTAWIPSLAGMEEKLRRGGRVADVGCGHGASTILMAEKFVNSEFYGFDYHQQSIDVARQRATERGLTNVFFKKVDAEAYEQGNFDLICFFDCLHDLGDPGFALRHARTKLAPSGSLLIVEPNASDNVEENFNPIGRMFYAASTALCVPHAHAEGGDYCLGAQAGPSAIKEIAEDAGFSVFRIAQQTPVNLIYEAKV